MAHIVFIESNVSGSGYRALNTAKNMDLEVTFVTRNASHYTKGKSAGEHPISQVDHLLETETNSIPALVEKLREFHQKHPIDAVLSLGDYYIEAAACVAESMGLPGVNPAAVRFARNKEMTRELCLQNGIPSPLFQVVRTFDEALEAAREIGFPCVCKPTDQNSSINVAVACNPSELKTCFDSIKAVIHNARGQKRSDQVLIEEYMTGREVSLETVTTGAGMAVAGVTGKEVSGFPCFVETGHVFPFQLPPEVEAEVLDLVRKCQRAIGLNYGPCHTEVKLTPAGPRIVEVNARLPGGLITELIGYAAGIHLVAEVIRMSLGEEPDLSPKRRAGAAIRFLTAPATGVLLDIKGQDAAACMPGIMEVEVSVGPGETVRAPRSNNDRYGYVIGVGNKAVEAEQRVQEARKRLEFVVERRQERC